MINNITKNRMGTTSFDGKFGRMRKAQDFIVYQLNGQTNTLFVQSDNRWAEIDIQSKVLTLSTNHEYANSMTLAMDIARGKDEKVTINTEQLNELIENIKGTASPMAGGNNCLSMYCDNSNADKI